MHRRLNLSPVRRLALFQNALHLFIAKARQSRERRRKLRPIGDGAHRLDPDRSALKPSRTIELILRVARRVAFGAFRYLLDEIASPASGTIRGFRGEAFCAPPTMIEDRAPRKSRREKTARRVVRIIRSFRGESSTTHMRFADLTKNPSPTVAIPQPRLRAVPIMLRKQQLRQLRPRSPQCPPALNTNAGPPFRKGRHEASPQWKLTRRRRRGWSRVVGGIGVTVRRPIFVVRRRGR